MYVELASAAYKLPVGRQLLPAFVAVEHVPVFLSKYFRLQRGFKASRTSALEGQMSRRYTARLRRLAQGLGRQVDVHSPGQRGRPPPVEAKQGRMRERSMDAAFEVSGYR